MQPMLLALALALSPDELQGKVAELKDSVKEIRSDVDDIKVALGMPVDGKGECPCITLPEAIKREDGEVTTASGMKLPEGYGAQCTQHDLTTDGCSGEYKAAYCYESWCYVDKACAEKDTKSSFYFGKETELYYSYQNCGGLDAFAAEACAAADEEAPCEEISSSCAWNKGAGSCQNKLCQCTGDNLSMDTAKLGFEDGYGETCAAWDEQSCEEYKDKNGGTELGLWCCKSWCYVPEECPSGKPSAVDGMKGLFYSYFACPDEADVLGQCKWEEPINFDGSPVALSSSAAAGLNEAAKAEGFLKKMRKHHRVRRQ